MVNIFKKVTVSCLVMTMLNGCLIILDDECSKDDPEYWYTDQDCYVIRERVQVCDYYDCWIETRSRRICEEHHICRDQDWR